MSEVADDGRTQRYLQVLPRRPSISVALCIALLSQTSIHQRTDILVSALSSPSKDSFGSNRKSSGGGGGGASSTRRGRNNHNGKSFGSKNQRWFHQRKAGVTVSKRTKPPQWEREGDDLYASISKSQINSTLSIPNTWDEAMEMLQQTMETHDPSTLPPTKTSAPLDTLQEDPSEDKPFLWGGLSVGPIWKARLQTAGFQHPTPVQVQAFDAILQQTKNNSPIRRQNVVIASPTGSGKTLAYLLPFLTTLTMPSQKKTALASTASSGGTVWIVTPTVELAFQIQNVVQSLLPVLVDNTKGGSNTSCRHVHVLQSSQSRDDDSGTTTPFPLLCQIRDNHQPPPAIIAGTPKLLLQLRKEIKNAMPSTRRNQTPFTSADDAGDGVDPSIPKLAKTLHTNLEAVILDEADRLLQTKPINKNESPIPMGRTIPTISSAHDLLQKLVLDSSYRSSYGGTSLQVVCASATVGRSLRRQLMDILGEPSMDKAAILVTADLRTKKHVSDRKASLLPDNLQHAFYVVREDSTGSCDLPQVSPLLHGLEKATDLLDPLPSIVFPGPVGVEKAKDFLEQQGFQNVRGLADVGSSTVDDDHPTTDWKLTTPIYVIKERLGRGLDLCHVKYVFLLGVPSNAASYAHLAGRTARQHDQVGTCITVLDPSEAPQLVTVAEKLGFTAKSLENIHRVVVSQGYRS
ncbi:ATP-dependent RNA helicase YfmL [Nitzschia inconspicua]|uniref:ATP-dependent RNA helicase n=1 Tax=Nitzschia inconspicua TaxID=303405 RepID=A0A9K3KHZ6_9STRA|nr:ATP-dependent RNA helicase YfmL [Nitzschia inconspicua]